jgi:2-succinyl-5-enolpyruvyl-6-hydroxy-3-cyclohexene-1-carboxylate synthase
VLNFAPAIVEAYYQNIPLWIFTADRPLGWEGKGENQTIHQLEIYKNYITRSVQLEETITLQKAQHLFDDIVCNDFKGPIHFNFPFSEPLYKTVEIDSVQFEISEKKIKEVEIPEIPPHSKIAILVSESLPNLELNDLLANIGKRDDVIILTELNSNSYSEYHLTRIDAILKDEMESHFYPDFLITIGGPIISKRARNFFKKIPNLIQIDLATYPRKWKLTENDTISINYAHLKEVLTKLFNLKDSCISKEFKSYWINKENAALLASKRYLDSISYSEYKVCQAIIENTPKDSVIFWGNSSAIRYGGWSMWQERPDLKHISNRGTSGIEGVLATAIGWKKANPKDHIVCILGDISALYEVNSFLAMNEIESMTVVVLNNFGGKIFDNIHPDFSQKAWNAIATPHQQHFEYFAKISNAAYHVFDTLEQENISALLHTTTRQIIEFQFNENTHKDWKEIMG